MQAITRLGLAAFGMHIADQSALVAVPLAAALVFEASAETIGLLVACQALAHLLGSIPFGLIVDRCDQRKVALASALVSFLGLAGAAAGLLLEDLLVFALSITFAGFGVVLFVLVALSIVPRLAGRARIAAGNATIEIPRALASFLVPLAIGVAVTSATAAPIFAAAALCALGALLAAGGLPSHSEKGPRAEPLLRQIAEGGRFVIRHDLLRPILLCALFWNLAFFALLVVLVPLIVQVYRAEAGAFGMALAAFGLGAVGGSWTAGRFGQRIATNVILLFGPGSSALALLALTLVPAGASVMALYAAFFVLGFGPAMWLIAQNSVRQLVTPGGQLGRVNAVIQTAIYGMRPLGALLGGAVTGAFSPETGLGLVAGGFLLSFAAALFSRLRSLRRFEDLRALSAA